MTSLPHQPSQFVAHPHILAMVLALALPVASSHGQTSKQTADFDRDIRPILSENCYKCHGPDDAARKAKMRLDVRAETLKPAKSGDLPIVPGAPDKSEVF